MVSGSGNTLTGSYGTMTAVGPGNVVQLGQAVEGYVESGGTVYADREGASGFAGECCQDEAVQAYPG